MKNTAFIIIFLSLSVQADNAYKCIQANGKTTFSDRPCPVDSTEKQIDVKKTTWQEKFERKFGDISRRLEITEKNEDTIIKINIFSTKDLNNTIKQLRDVSGQNVNLLKINMPRVGKNGTAIFHVTNNYSSLVPKSSAQDNIRTQNSPIFERNDFEIRKILNASKGKLFAVYNKELRQKPNLKGKFFFYFGISPEGKVFDAKVKSKISDSSFESKLLEVIMDIEFGSKQVAIKYIEWPIEFLSNESS